MTSRRPLPSVVALAAWTLTSLGLAGCEDDPPPPPPATSASADPTGKSRTPRGTVPRVSPETVKIYRVDSCLFGAHALRYAKEEYLSSLGGEAPSADNLPSFGEYDQPSGARRRAVAAKGETEKGSGKTEKGSGKTEKGSGKTEKGSGEARKAQGDAEAESKKDASERTATSEKEDASGKKAAASDEDAAGKKAATDEETAKTRKRAAERRRRRTGKRSRLAARQLPFIRYLRSCALAREADEPAHAELDEALTAWSKYYGPVYNALRQATRYYATEGYERDEFKRGKALHAQLAKSLPELDDELARLTKAVQAYRKEHSKPKEKLDEAGKIAQRAVDEARSVAMSFVGDELDTEAIEKSLEKLGTLQKKLAAQAKKSPAAPHPKVVPAEIAGFVEAVERAIDGEEGPDARERYRVYMAMASLLRDHQNAINRLVSRRGASHPKVRMPSKMKRPQINRRVISPKMRRKLKKKGDEGE